MTRAERAIKDSRCRRCRRTREFFYYRRDTYKFDVDMAWEFVKDGRAPVEVDEQSVRTAVKKCVIDWKHVKHITTDFPGLIAHVQYYDAEDPTVVKGHLLIDGHHRAARSLKEKKPYFAYVLTEEESAKIVVRAPYLNLKQEEKPQTAKRVQAKRARAKGVRAAATV